MPTYTVTEIVSTRPWTPHGETEPKTIYYDVKVEGENRSVNVGRRPGNPLTPGTVLEGDIVPDDRGGLKFKRATNGVGAGPRPRDPVEGARIIRQHSQSVAVASFAAQGRADFTIDELRQRIDWFDLDAKAAKP